MKKRKMMRRGVSMLLAALLCMSCLGGPVAFAADPEPFTPAASSAPLEPEAAKTGEESPDEPKEEQPAAAEGDTEENDPDGIPEKEPAEPETPAEDEPDAAEGLSAEAKAFVSAVEDLDRENILSASNAWGLAHLAWLEDKDNPGLQTALDEAAAVSDEAAAALYAAEDLYYTIPEDEQGNEAIQTAYLALMSLIVAMHEKMDHPITPAAPTDPDEPANPGTNDGDETPTEPDRDEITSILYSDLPDAPTDYYMGRYGLPVATGETKISISQWHDGQMAAAGYMDADALNSDGQTITVPSQEGAGYAVVPIFIQVEYPGNGSSSRITLPNDVTLLDYNGNPADEQTAAALLNSSYAESSAAVTGIYVQADHDFTVAFQYTSPEGNNLEKSMTVHVNGTETAAPVLYGADIATYSERPAPDTTSGKITRAEKVGGTWLIWFNGEPAYCCSHGLKGTPNGCPTYSYTHTSLVTADQYTPGDHYGNQVGIWGGLGQLSLGLLSADASMDTAYDDVQRWIIANYPDSVAAKSYLRSTEQMNDGVASYASESDYYTYIYQPPVGGWQTVAVIGPATGSIDPDAPGVEPEYYADWSAPAQTVSGSFDLDYTVNTDKKQLATGEKVDGATIEIEPLVTSGTIDGGSWSISPADKQVVVTSGHTMDDSYHLNGGDATASWNLHYSVSKTSGTRSGSVGPCSSQEEADIEADSARRDAEAQLRTEAQRMVDSAIAAAKNQLSSLQFRYEETGVPYGFGMVTGSLGSSQIIAVPANTSQDYPMLNDEWSLQIKINKVDSETGEQIAADAEYEVFEWDAVTQQYIPYGGYNQYTVVRNEDGTYSVANGSSYGTGFDTSRTLYYTQRNEGRFIIVESKAPNGYYGDWTDIEQPGTSGTPLGKRGYYIEITAENDGSVIWLDNADYNADIAVSYIGGDKLLTAQGEEATVTIHDQPQDAGRTYVTDRTGLANNEDGYTLTPAEDVFQNDRVLGEIILTKSDLDQLLPSAMAENKGEWKVPGTAPHGEANIEGAVYDLYAAQDVLHPDGVSGVVDYSKIIGQDGSPIWHTTVRTNSGWDSAYLPILTKDHLVASAAIKDGMLVFSNLYLGEYYLVERATGLVLPVDTGGKFYITGQYPEVDRRLKPTGEYTLLNQHGSEYSDYVYKNQYSAVAEGRALDGTKTYDGYYLSFADGYLCDEVNHYQTLLYGDESGYVIRENVHSLDAVLKGGFELRKLVSTTGPGSPAPKLEGAGFTVYRIAELRKESQFTRNPDGSYNIPSVLDAYRKDNYDSTTLKYDFIGEEQAIARMFESDAGLVDTFNSTLTEAGDNANGSGLGWVPMGTPNEYRLSEIYTNEEGVFRVTGLPYDQYLVVESTIPKDVFQCDPFGFQVNSSTPQSTFCQPNGSVTKPSNSYLTYNILDEEMEGYLRLIKTDVETGKAVRLADTAFAIYMLHEDGSRERLSMIAPVSGDPTRKTDVFHTDSEGRMKTPEKLPLGRYEVVELEGPNGFFNDKQYSVEFEISSDSAWEVVGNAVNGMDEYILTQEYLNHETLGLLTIRKTGEVLVDYTDGQFVYEERPIPGAEFTITAAEDIFTQDRQVNADGSRTLWYAKGDVIAMVRTGDGASDIAVFRPGRAQATYDFLSVVHNEIGEVSVTLPLGSYHVKETQPPYGYTGSSQSYDVTLAWNNQANSVVMARSITYTGENGTSNTTGFEIVNAENAAIEFTEQQVLKFHNEREKIQVKTIKLDDKTGKALAGAVFNLYTQDDIYNADGKCLFQAGDLLATSAPTGEDGTVVFDCDLPMQDARYGEAERQNSGRYFIRELRAPNGYFLNEEPMEIMFLYTGAEAQVLESVCRNEGTSVLISKRQLTGSDELAGATLRILDRDGKVIREWISSDKPQEIRGLELDKPYTLVEVTAPNGYEIAESIRFKLVQRVDEEGTPLNEVDTYICTGKDWLVFDHWELIEDGTVIMRDAPAPERPYEPHEPEQPQPTPQPSVPAPAPQTGDASHPVWAASVLGISLAALSALIWCWYKRRQKSKAADPDQNPHG